jgi:phosphatidylinositol alpha-1,6-mannosyltransferase
VDDIDDYYRRADLFVLPTESESFGLVFLEALAYGTPVVGTTGVPTDVIPDDTDEIGYRVPPDHPERLADAILSALRKEWDYERIQAYAREFSWESNIDKFEHVYETHTSVD